jgi:protease YdgD
MKLAKIVFFLLGLLATAPVVAAPKRLHVEAMEYPFSAAGRLNMGGRAWCSAVLIGPRHIVTAAHCLWNPVSQAWWPASSIHFIAGYQGGEASLVSLAQHYVIADGYDATAPDKDWAIVELAEPLGERAGWITGALSPQRPIGQLGYRADSAHAMTLDFGCQMITNWRPDGLSWNDCDAMHGDSGGPLLSFTKDGPRLLGIVVVSGHVNGRAMTASVPASALTDAVRFPRAATAAAAAGWGGPAHAPTAGSPVAALPVQTLARLGSGDRKPSLALLATLLAAP